MKSRELKNRGLKFSGQYKYNNIKGQGDGPNWVGCSQNDGVPHRTQPFLFFSLCVSLLFFSLKAKLREKRDGINSICPSIFLRPQTLNHVTTNSHICPSSSLPYMNQPFSSSSSSSFTSIFPLPRNLSIPPHFSLFPLIFIPLFRFLPSSSFTVLIGTFPYPFFLLITLSLSLSLYLVFSVFHSPIYIPHFLDHESLVRVYGSSPDRFSFTVSWGFSMWYKWIISGFCCIVCFVHDSEVFWGFQQPTALYASQEESWRRRCGCRRRNW